MQTNNAHEYTDEQIQAAIDAAFPAGALEVGGIGLDNLPTQSSWKEEAPNRLAIARAFLAALPKQDHFADASKKVEPDLYARLKAYNRAGARIRCGVLGEWSPRRGDRGWSWSWDCPPEHYEVHPDDLHLCPEYAPKAETQPTELDTLRNTWGRVSAAVDAIDHKGDNTSIDDVLARLAVFKAPEGRQTLPFFAAPHETEAIHELCKLQDMSQQAVLRQALRCYQQEVLRRHGITADLPKPAPWTLPAPPPGRRWHREDWKPEWLEGGFRPLLDGESRERVDEWSYDGNEWRSVYEYGPAGDHVDGTSAHHRTRRPLPAESSAEPEKADDGPAWIPHDGGPCPLKDEEVETFEFKTHTGTSGVLETPSVWRWSHDGNKGDIIAYRVWKWKPGHGPQASTFTGHDGKTYNRHTPGNPCPVDKNVDIVILDRLQKVWTTKDCPDSWWTAEYSNPIIGWRYADEPAQEKAVCDRCGGTGWEYEDEVAGHLRCSAGCQIPAQPWTPAPGDVVRLKSGGHSMTIVNADDPAAVMVSWSHDNAAQFSAFPAACLTTAKEGQP